jgi:hypothetical protein
VALAGNPVVAVTLLLRHSSLLATSTVIDARPPPLDHSA